MLSRLLEPFLRTSEKSVLLLGPRQVGKSTLLQSLQPDLTINLALESEFFRFSTDPSLLEANLAAEKPRLVFLDEVQRLPSLLNTAQALLDEAKSRRQPLRFLFSGSSARKLRRGQANLLPGRVLAYELSGLCAKELDSGLSLDRALRLGFLPEPYLEKNERTAEKLLSSYAATYLKEEIQAEALARNIQGFSRFLVTLASHSGKIIDYSKLSSKAKVSRTSCVRFMEILEDTLIAQLVPVFEEAESADTIKHSKFYFFDVGVLNGLLNNFTLSEDRKGMLFEHFIYQQIRNSALAQDKTAEIFYFRTRSGLEVDFIVRIGRNTWAIEAKTGEISSTDLNPLKTFREYYPSVSRCIAVSTREPRKRVVNDILICDWREMLTQLGLL